ncbi:hypothetical protein A6V39_04545 [Candidatus Mycoplasma haematobovis]|uniref:Uncharacterized protein n=1 Tax=Candidatus Mycoplasma haematobovis TaxID=432608 RepID=A0A1A9QDI8_9MOLU|nr:hypothetical protein [Candidatus Mycoplasma haematobovis]OAL10154.1 hypothetical protein A6V39_04545 [Candidatus Mycoplasma haematobovis]
MANYRLFSTVLLTAGAVAGVREYLKPRDIQSMLKWNGVRLVSNNDGWKSAFYENKEQLEKLGVRDSNDLWKWCSERFKYGLGDPTILTDVENYCKDSPKTIMGNIIRAGEEGKLIKESDQLASQIVYVTTSDREKLIEVMQIEADDQQRGLYAFMGKKISEWCAKEVKKNVVDVEHLGNVKKYCYNRGVKNVKGLLEKEGLKTLPSTDDYKERFKNELSRSQELITQIGHTLNAKRAEKLKEYEFRKRIYNYTQEEQEIEMRKIDEIVPATFDDNFIKANSGQYLKWWCESQYNSNLTGTGVFPEIYQRVKARCTIKKS